MALPPELMAALGGVGGAPAPAGPAPGGVPPELMALLGGGGALPEDPAEPAGDPEEMYAAALEATDDPVTLIRWSLDMARKAAQFEDDDEDTLKLEKATTGLAQYLSDLQKDQDGLLQGKSTPKSMRRATAGYGA